MKIAIAGLALTSSWGNGHATTYRALMKALSARGHEVLFLERDVPWYAENRDLPQPPYGRVGLYDSVAELKASYSADIESADLVMVGSYVPDGISVADLVHGLATGVTAFYDIDTPVTLARLDAGQADYISREQIPRYDLYLSFTGGPILERLRVEYGARRPRPLYCSVDCEAYYPDPSVRPQHDLGYLGTYSPDRQPALERLLLKPAGRWPGGRFVVAGPQYPADVRWPSNVQRIEHLSPAEHRQFYNRLRYTLNVTRGDMVRAGYSPSVRLFEAAACGTPIVSDVWPGIDEFFVPGLEILLARDSGEALSFIRDIQERERRAMAERARHKVIRHHSSVERARELEAYVAEAAGLAAGPAEDAAQAVTP